MSRLPLTFVCQGCTLGATLDTAPGTTGLLMVTGGSEIRAGAFAGQARLAATIAAAGFPVLRFDRRGIGDSEGEDPGFAGSEPDILAAAQAFLAMSPQLTRVVGWGNCDAASALMLGSGCGLDGLVLSNPWTLEDEADAALPPAASVRQRYIAKLKNPREVARLLTGGVNYRKLLKGVAKAASRKDGMSALVEAMRDGLAAYTGPVDLLIAEADRTGLTFEEAWGEDARIVRCPEADHAFSQTAAFDFLTERLLVALRR